MKNIDEFVDKLVAEKGFDTKDAEVLAQIKADLSSRIVDQVNAMILSNMPESALEGFEQALDAGDDAKVGAYTKEHIPDIDEKVASLLLSFKSNYLA